MNNPYYIIAPPYMRTSAGVRVLYRLCDLLNRSGCSAFIYMRPHISYDLASSPMDIAPFLNKRIVDYHFKNGLTPIVVYPETVNVSRFNPPFSVRYVLNYDNYLFENDSLENDDYVLSYSQNIADQLNVSVNQLILNLPVSDATFYCPPEVEHRQGGVFYAGKYKYHFGGKTFAITNGMVEITRDQKDSQTPEQIRDLFQTAEFFYCYEDTALALEAMLCGCPVILLPNEFFKESLGAKELRGLGYAWGTSDDQVSHAKESVIKVRERYYELQNEAKLVLDTFVRETQLKVSGVKYAIPFADQYIRSPSYVARIFGLLRLINETSEDKGLLKTFATIFKRLKAKRFRISS